MDEYEKIKEKVEEKVEEVKEKVKEKVKKSKIKEVIHSKPKARFEGHYYIWENGKKTHISFIQKAIQRGYNLPIGFYEAAEASPLHSIKTLLRVAKLRKIPADVEKLDTRQ